MGRSERISVKGYRLKVILFFIRFFGFMGIIIFGCGIAENSVVSGRLFVCFSFEFRLLWLELFFAEREGL